MADDVSKLPRLYVVQDLAPGAAFMLTDEALHYFRSVLRRQPGDALRVFNGRDGEYRAVLRALDKKQGEVEAAELLRPQPTPSLRRHLLFAPIKKQRLDLLVEKSVELGATDLHPVLTARCEVRSLNPDRLRAQIAEAAEQCERMDVPVLHELTDLKGKLAGGLPSGPILWCRERAKAPFISIEQNLGYSFLIGPEGGFTDEETALLERTPGITAVSLGETVYRAETAAMLCLAAARLSGG